MLIITGKIVFQIYVSSQIRWKEQAEAEKARRQESERRHREEAERERADRRLSHDQIQRNDADQKSYEAQVESDLLKV